MIRSFSGQRQVVWQHWTKHLSNFAVCYEIQDHISPNSITERDNKRSACFHFPAAFDLNQVLMFTKKTQKLELRWTKVVKPEEKPTFGSHHVRKQNWIILSTRVQRRIKKKAHIRIGLICTVALTCPWFCLARPFSPPLRLATLLRPRRLPLLSRESPPPTPFN